MPELPSKLTRAVPATLASMATGLAYAAGSGYGLDLGGGDITTAPTYVTAFGFLLAAVGMGRGQFWSAALAPPVDKDGNESARYTCSIALGQAHREGDQELVDLLAKSVSRKKPAPAPAVPTPPVQD